MPAVARSGSGQYSDRACARHARNAAAVVDRGMRLAAAHGDARQHAAERRDRVANDASVVGEFVQHRRGEDQDVAGVVRDELLANRADGAERACDVGAGLVAECGLQRLDDALGGAGAQHDEVDGASGIGRCRAARGQDRGHRSTLAPETLMTFSHFAMSSAT